MVDIAEIPNKFIKFFNKHGWEYRHHEELHVLKATTEELPMMEVGVVYSETGFLTIFELPLKIEEDTKTETLEYVIRVNLDIDIGTFKIDLSNGTIIFTSYTNTTDIKTIPEAFVIQSMVGLMGPIVQFIPGLYAVITGESDAETAYRKVSDEE